MFKVLTGEKKRRVISPATVTASLAAHLLLLGGFVYVAAAEPERTEALGPVLELPELVEEKKETPPPPRVEQPTPPPPADEPAPAPVPGEVLQIEQVTRVPTDIEPEEPGAVPIDLDDYRRDGRPGDYIGPPAAEPAPPTARENTSVTPFYPTVDMVEVRPELDRNGLSRMLERHYPAVLRDSRVSGRVVIELVVDENGRPLHGTARVIEASHPAFGEATLRVVDRFRFSPALMAGTPVPVLVTIPIQWTAR